MPSNFTLVAVIAAISTGYVRADDIVINEIMYHPASGIPLEEFIELYNKGTTTVNLGGWRFKQGVKFTVPTLTIVPGGYLVVASDLATFQSKYPGVNNVIGGWVGTLSNSDEDLELVDGAGKEIDGIHYASTGDWSVRTRGLLDRNHQGWTWISGHDGGGKSLELINPVL